jgi:hypothetical protein
MCIKSKVIKISSHLFWYFSTIKHVCAEFGALFGILEDGRHFDGAGPIDVVEALAEDELLKCLLLQLAISIDHTVAAGLTLEIIVGLLTDDEKVLVFT